MSPSSYGLVERIEAGISAATRYSSRHTREVELLVDLLEEAKARIIELQRERAKRDD